MEEILEGLYLTIKEPKKYIFSSKTIYRFLLMNVSERKRYMPMVNGWNKAISNTGVTNTATWFKPNLPILWE